MPLLKANGEKPTADELLAGEMLDILRGRECFACDGYKRPWMPHCFGCQGRLSPDIKQALYSRIGEGYEEAYRTSLKVLEGN